MARVLLVAPPARSTSRGAVGHLRSSSVSAERRRGCGSSTASSAKAWVTPRAAASSSSTSSPQGHELRIVVSGRAHKFLAKKLGTACRASPSTRSRACTSSSRATISTSAESILSNLEKAPVALQEEPRGHEGDPRRLRAASRHLRLRVRRVLLSRHRAARRDSRSREAPAVRPDLRTAGSSRAARPTFRSDGP